MDYERVNRASNLISKSPTFRRNIKYNMQQEIAEQKYRDYEFEKQNTARTNTLESIEQIETLARTYARRDKDVARMEEIYGEAAENFKNIIQTKYGGDITRFWYEGGQAELEGFKKTVLGGEEALRMKKNTEEFAKYFDVIKKKGGMQNVFNTTSKQASLYASGQLDDFRMPIADRLPYEQPSSQHINNQPSGSQMVDAILSYSGNEQSFRLNYANENNINPDIAFDVPYDTIRKYAASYVGGLAGPGSIIKNKEPQLANSISSVFESFGQIDGNKIIDTQNRSTLFQEGNKRLQQLSQQSNSQIEDSPIYGNMAFEDYLPEIINTFVDNSFVPGKDFKENNVILEGKSVNHSDGTWFGNGGIMLEEGATLSGKEWTIQGVTLSYKTIEEDSRLLTKEDVESGNYAGKVQPVYVANLINESVFGDDFVSKELNFNNSLKAQKLNKLIEYDESTYQQSLSKKSEYIKPEQMDSFLDIDRNSSPSRMYEFALYNNNAVNNQFNLLGVQAPSLGNRALMLAFSQLFNTDIDELHELFSLHNSPDLYEAIVSNDPQLFIQNFGLLAKERGVSDENVEMQTKELAELATSIVNSIMSEQK